MPLEAFAVGRVDGAYHDEGFIIDLVADTLDLIDLPVGAGAEQNIFIRMRVGAFAVQDRDAALDLFVDARGDTVAVARDDRHQLSRIVAVHDLIDENAVGDGHDKAVERRVDRTVNDTAEEDDDAVNSEGDEAEGELRVLAADRHDDEIGAAGRGIAHIDTCKACAGEDAAEYRSEDRFALIEREMRHQIVDDDRGEKDRLRRAEEEPQTERFETDYNDRDIDNDRSETDRYKAVRQLIHDDRDAGYPAGREIGSNGEVIHAGAVEKTADDIEKHVNGKRLRLYSQFFFKIQFALVRTERFLFHSSSVPARSYITRNTEGVPAKR